ncbi:MAG: hypothetical protein R2849_15215 [Thermomicrobiales bacterium]
MNGEKLDERLLDAGNTFFDLVLHPGASLGDRLRDLLGQPFVLAMRQPGDRILKL